MPRAAATVELCDGRPKPAHIPEMIAAFSAAYRQSLRDTEALEWFAKRGAGEPRATWRVLREFTKYVSDPPCIDTAPSIGEALHRQLSEGVFGDCVAYAVATAALARMQQGRSGCWLLMGDENDTAQHIVNWFGNPDRPGQNPESGALIIDCTQEAGDGWKLPAGIHNVLLLEPQSGASILRWSREGPTA